MCHACHVSVISDFIVVSRQQMFCRACVEEKYSLKPASVLVHETVATIHDRVHCLKCPYGAKCDRGIWNNVGFWGRAKPNTSSVTMYPCPQDYCVQNKATSVAYDSCADGRTGLLCGRCRDGYSESLFGTECIPDENCGWKNWYVAVIIAVYGILYVLFFMFEHDYSRLIDYISKKFQRQKTRANSEGSELSEAGYFPIFMYYIQTSQLLRVKIVIKEDESYDYLRRPDDLLPGYIVDGVSSLFSFDGLAFGREACLSRGMTPVMKTTWSSAFVLYLFAVLFLMFIFSGFCCCCLTPKRRPRIGQLSMSERMLATFVSLFLYTYQEVAENALLLLNCTDVDGVSVLFHDGNVTCLQAWQYGVIVIVCVFVLPFFTVLLFGPRLLEVGRIHVLAFFLSFVFPLFLAIPMTVYFVELYRRPTIAVQAHNRRQNGERTICCGEKETGIAQTVVDVITGSYRNDIVGGVCWEGVINFRRMVLVLVFTFVNDVLLKQISLAFGCFVILLVHLRAMPFKQRFSNIFESVSLSMLIVISGTNLVKAAFYYTQTIPRGAAYFVMVVFEWIETVALGILPVGVVVLLVLSLVVRTGTSLVRQEDTESTSTVVTPATARTSTREPRVPYIRASNVSDETRGESHVSSGNSSCPRVQPDSDCESRPSSWYDHSERGFRRPNGMRLALCRYTSRSSRRCYVAPDSQLYPQR